MWCYLVPHQNILSRLATNQLTRLCVAEPVETDQITNSDMMSPMEEQPQYIYATNGYVDQTGGPPPPVYYINGESLRFRGYEQLPDAYIAVYVCTRVGCRLSCVSYLCCCHAFFFAVATISFLQKMIRINSKFSTVCNLLTFCTLHSALKRCSSYCCNVKGMFVICKSIA